MIKLSDSELKLIKSILAVQIPGYKVKAFGSRISGKAETYSDLDLVVIGKSKLSLEQKAHLKDAFSESNLPFRVDISDWNTLSDEFKKIIKNNNIIIQEAN